MSTLFAALHAPALALSGAPQAVVDHLVAMQFRSQTATYRVRFPDARRFLIVDEVRPVGRIVVQREARDLYVVDVALHPEAQGRGLGGEAVAEVQREATALGLGVRALVFADNGPSLAMFRRRGFSPTGRPAEPSIELRWIA